MTKRDSNVDRVYAELRQLAANFEFKPDARLNESALATQLGASRTPLREALNRLVAEGFLTFQSGRGFFCRSLSPSLVMDLYGARVAVECEAVRLVCRNASDSEIEALAGLQQHGKSVEALRDLDEAFHLRIAELSGNGELLRMLENLNDRSRYIRMVYLRGRFPENGGALDHSAVIAALRARNEDAASSAMRAHIERRREDAAQAVRMAYSELYVPDELN